MRLKISAYSFELEWKAGKTHFIADALSRAPVLPAEADDDSTATKAICRRLGRNCPTAEFQEAAKACEKYRATVKAIKTYSEAAKVPNANPARCLVKHWDELSLIGEEGEEVIIINGKVIVVPQKCRKSIIAKIHEAHSGWEKSKTLAQQLYFWPGMTNDIKQSVDNCAQCQEMKPSQQVERTVEHDKPFAPMSHMGLDMFSLKGKDWLICVDEYSGWPFAAKMSKTSTEAITEQLSDWFEQFGWPSFLRSDNGPQFRSNYISFCSDHQIQPQFSAPYHSSGNGLAEAAVRNVKHLLTKAGDNKRETGRLLSAFRNMPRADGFSPAELFLGRKLKRQLPMLPAQLEPNGKNFTEGRAAREQTKERQSAQLNKRARDLPNLTPGQIVFVQDPVSKRWDSLGQVESVRQDGKSYQLMNQEGKQFVRNRRMLRPAPIKEGVQLSLAEANDILHGKEPLPVMNIKKESEPRRSPRFANLNVSQEARRAQRQKTYASWADAVQGRCRRSAAPQAPSWRTGAPPPRSAHQASTSWNSTQARQATSPRSCYYWQPWQSCHAAAGQSGCAGASTFSTAPQGASTTRPNTWSHSGSAGMDPSYPRYCPPFRRLAGAAMGNGVPVPPPTTPSTSRWGNNAYRSYEPAPPPSQAATTWQTPASQNPFRNCQIFMGRRNLSDGRVEFLNAETDNTEVVTMDVHRVDSQGWATDMGFTRKTQMNQERRQ